MKIHVVTYRMDYENNAPNFMEKTSNLSFNWFNSYSRFAAENILTTSI